MSKRSKEFFVKENKAYPDFFHREGFDKYNFPQEFFMILGLFVEDSNCHITSAYIDHSRLFIAGSNYNGSKRCELMLRYGNRKLIVARIEFIHRRQGYMTRLYHILQIIQKKYRLDKIIIETCQTEASKNWAIKNGFINVYGESFQEK